MDIFQILIGAGGALGRVLLVGLLLGAGLPALFALGVRSLPAGRAVAGGDAVRPSSPSTIPAAMCFGLCLLAVAAGVAVIAFGTQLFGG